MTHQKLTPEQYEQIQNDTVKALSGLHHVSIAPRKITQADRFEFRISNLEALVHAQAIVIQRFTADKQGGE